MFTGDFTGKQATIGVIATDDGKAVHSVVVLFDSSEDWNILVSTYDYYKDLYTRKYGSPAVNQENNPSRINSNFMLMHELAQGTVTYVSAWEAPGGTIELSIEKSSSLSDSGMVMIKYRDSLNVETKIQNDLDDI